MFFCIQFTMRGYLLFGPRGAHLVSQHILLSPTASRRLVWKPTINPSNTQGKLLDMALPTTYFSLLPYCMPRALK